MRYILSLDIIVAASTAVQGLTAQGKEAAPVQPSTTAADMPSRMPSRPASIPFKLRDNLVTVAATINGQSEVAVLDSGAGAIVIDREFTHAIGLKAGQSVGEVAGGGAQAQQLLPVNISSLVVGPIRFDGIDAYSVNLEQLSSSAGFPVRLLIGAPAFKYGAITFDYKRQRVTFGPSGSSPRCAAPIPLTVVHDVPIVEVELRATPSSEPARLKLVVDLGTRHQAMIIGGPFVRSDAGKALVQSGQAQKIGHGTGGEIQGSIAKVAHVKIGMLEIQDLEVALSSGAPVFESGAADGSLGVPLWKEGRVTFDYPARTLCIER